MAKQEEVEIDSGEVKSSTMKWVIIGILGGVLLLGGAGGTMFALGMFGSDDVEAAAEGGQAKPEPKKEAFYVSIEPPFTVNLQDSGRARFLQVSVDVMTRELEMEDALKTHMPMIRNNLVMLFSSKSTNDLANLNGKQQLQDEALNSIQSVLERETGDKGVEAVFFTSFVMQ